MYFKVKIKNFQKIKSANLSFEPGLTVIVGATNNGKTAILRAIEAALFNKSVDSSISYGSDYSDVAISYGNNLLVWKRNKTKASKTTYKLNDTVMVKGGRGQLDEIRDAFNIKEITLLHTREKLNFWKQMKFPFLLDRTPAQLFEFIVMSSEETNLAQVLKMMNTDMKEISNNIQVAESIIDDYKQKMIEEQNELKRFEGCLGISKEIMKMDSDVKMLSEVELKRNKCKELSIEITSNKNKLAEMSKDKDEIRDLISFLEDNSIEEKFLEGGINNWEQVIKNKEYFVDKHKSVEAEIKKLEVVSKSEIDSYLLKEEDTKKSSNLIFDYESSKKLNEEIEQDLVDVNKEILEIKLEIEKFKVCPLCGQSI